MVDNLFQTLPRKVVTKIKTLCQVLPELVSTGNSVSGLNYLLRQPKRCSPAPTIRNMITFSENISRQHIISQHRCRGHKYLMRYDEILVHHRF